MEHRIAVASGHHNSIGVLIDGNRISATTRLSESLNLHALEDQQLIDQLLTLLNSLAQKDFGGDGRRLLENATRLALSLPGAAANLDIDRARSIVTRNGWRRASNDDLCIADDTWTGLLAGLQDDSGICAFSGTGASVLVAPGAHYPKQWPYKLDGLGPVVGDFGSGFSVGNAMLQTAARAILHFDSPAPLGGLDNYNLNDIALVWQRVLKQAFLHPPLFELNRIPSWFEDVLRNEPKGTWRLRIAELATIATEMADSKPPNNWAASLIKGAANQFADTLNLAITRFRPDTEALRITCQGGMFRHSRLYLETVQHKLQSDFAKLELAPYRPIVGAVFLVASETWQMPDASITKEILQSIDDLDSADRRHFLNDE